jgi:DNA-binding Xre family transcriptional regulator
MNIVPVIQEHMAKSGLTAYGLHKATGISYKAVRSILEEGTKINLVTLEKISKALGVDMWRLVKEAE